MLVVDLVDVRVERGNVQEAMNPVEVEILNEQRKEDHLARVPPAPYHP